MRYAISVVSLALLGACEMGGRAPAAESLRTTTAAVQATPADLSDPAGLGAADRDCQIVLRGVTRQPGGDDYERECVDGVCNYVWRGTVEVAADIAPGVAVHVMYRRADDPRWWEVPAEPTTPAPGFARHAFALSEHLFGPAESASPPAIDLVAFARLPGGGRLFDHNRYPGDFENATLDEGSWWSAGDGGVCPVVAGRVTFAENGAVYSTDALRQGGYLQVDYDLDRMTQCRGTHNGHPAWDLQAFARFLPGGQVVSGSVRQLVSVMGHPSNEARDWPFIVEIPGDALRVELWFRNFSGAGSSCEAWDSAFGANYRFDVQPAPGDPRCLDVQRETGVNSEDPHMVHLAPDCLPYRLAAEYDATHCELAVVGFGDGHLGHYGIPYEWLVGYVAVGQTEGEVLNVGLYAQFRDNLTGTTGQRFSLGLPEGGGVWKVGLPDRVTGFQSVAAADLQVQAFAFFLDVRRADGRVVRLWESRHGANYRLEDAFGLPGSVQSIPYGNITWAHADAAVLASGRACR